MKYKQKYQQKSVHGKAEDYDLEMNRIFDEIGEIGSDVEIIDKIDPASEKPFATIIRWTEHKGIPESIADEMWLKGDRSECKDCPHFIQKDKRKKSGWCEFKLEERWKTENWCDHRYLEKELEIKDEE